VAGLEYAVGQQALILGKPSPSFFREGLRELRAEVRADGLRGGANGSRLARNGDVAMVGDDVWTDVLAAQRVGLRGLFVLSGKHGRAELAQAAAGSAARSAVAPGRPASRRSPGAGAGAAAAARGRPDGVAPSLVEIVAALD